MNELKFLKKNPFDLLFIQTKPSATLLIKELRGKKVSKKKWAFSLFNKWKNKKNAIQPWKDEGSIRPMVWMWQTEVDVLQFTSWIFRMKWAGGILNSKGYVRNYKKWTLIYLT